MLCHQMEFLWHTIKMNEWYNVLIGSEQSESTWEVPNEGNFHSCTCKVVSREVCSALRPYGNIHLWHLSLSDFLTSHFYVNRVGTIRKFRDVVSVLILTILTASQAPLVSLDLLFLRHDLRYVLILLRALSANSGNCRVHESIIAWIFSLGCFDIGTMRSRFSSTNRRTNIWKIIISKFKKNVTINP